MSPKCRTPQTLVAKVQGTFSRFGTRHLKGVVVTPYVNFLSKNHPKFSHSKKKKKTCYGLFNIPNSGSLQLKAEGSPHPTRKTCPLSYPFQSPYKNEIHTTDRIAEVPHLNYTTFLTYHTTCYNFFAD